MLTGAQVCPAEEGLYRPYPEDMERYSPLAALDLHPMMKKHVGLVSGCSLAEAGSEVEG